MLNGEDLRDSWLENGRNSNFRITLLDVGTSDPVSKHGFEKARDTGINPFDADSLWGR
jgi:hypothetical protein